MQTILSIIGTRPEGIKMAPVLKELERFPDQFKSVVCVTGQHRQMLDQVLEIFAIKPDIDLDLMLPNQTLAQLTANLFMRLDPVVGEVGPDWILAQGDTTTVMVAALVAYYRGARFGHIEAGLRTGDKHSPFPEEINRRVADVLADLYFAPTETARQQLLREGVRADTIHVTGNTVIDALLEVASRDFDWSGSPLHALPQEKRLVLVTLHRRESFGETLRQICLALRDLAREVVGHGIHFVYPVHLNPNVQGPVREILAEIENFSLIEPQDYFAFVHLMKRATLILTDSGGIQEEAPSLGVPVLVLRDTTERPEGITAGVVKLAGTQPEVIRQEALRLLFDQSAHTEMASRVNPYGDGQAAQRIVLALIERSSKS